MAKKVDNQVSDISQKDLDELMEKSKLFTEEDVKKITPLEDPRIYGFIVQELNEANDFCAVKVGDTYRTVNVRLSEWRKVYQHLVKLFDLPSYVDIIRTENDGYIQRFYFRDYVIHRALRELGYRHLKKDKTTNPEIVYQGELIIPENGVKDSEISEEFMIHPETIGQDQKAIIQDIQQKIEDIITDIKDSAEKGIDKYDLSTVPYNVNTNKKIDYSKMDDLTYSAYPYQDGAVVSLVDKFMQQYYAENCELGAKKAKVLLDAPTRSGKTAMINWALKSIFHKICESYHNNVQQKELIVFTTAIPDVFYEFQEFIQRHTSVKKTFKWVYKEDLIADYNDSKNAQNPIDKAWEKTDIIAIGASLQYLSGRTENGEIKTLHRIIKDRVSIVVADECHYGLFGNGESYKASFQDDEDDKTDDEIDAIEQAEKELFSLNPKYGYIFASATTYNILDNDAFSKDNVVFVRQSDVDAEKDKSFENLRKQEIDIKQSEFYGRPNRHFFGIDIDAPLNEIFEPTIQNNKTVFKNNAAYVVLDALFGIGDYDTVPPLLNNEVLKKAGAGRHILFQMSSKRACDALENYFLNNNNSDHPKLGYRILNTSSKNDSAKWTRVGIEDIKKEIYNNRFGKTIMITVNRGTTGVSIPQLDTEVLLNSSKSLTRRVQTYGRVNTPWVEKIKTKNQDGSIAEEKFCYKPNTFVIDFDATSLYNIQNDQEIINNNTGSGNADKPTMGTFWKFNGLTLSEMTQLDIHRQLNEYLKREKISSMVQKIPEFEFDTPDLKNILDGFDVKGQNNKDRKLVLNKKGEELVSRTSSTFTNTPNDGEAGSTDEKDDTEPVVSNTESKEEEERLKKEELLRAAIWERTLIYSLLDGDVNNIQSIVEKLHNSPDRTLINDLNMMFYLPIYEKILVDKNFHVLDALERAIKSVRARCLDDSGEFSVEGFFECVMGLNRVSANEVFTSEKVAELLLDKAGFDNIETLKNFAENNKTIIDNGDKSGIITAMFVKRLLENDFAVNSDNFYSVPTSPITYQITYKIFKELGLNTENILFVRGLDALTVNELLVLAMERKMGCQYSDKNNCYLHGNSKAGKAKRVELAGKPMTYPKQSKKITDAEYTLMIKNFEKDVVDTVLENIFDKIEDEDERIKARDFWEQLVKDVKKFDYAISNPPYQDESNTAIYQKFAQNSFLIVERGIAMIHKADFLHSSSRGDGLKDLMDLILENSRTKVIDYIDPSGLIFEGTTIDGGIIIYSIDKTLENPLENTVFNTITNKEELESPVSVVRPLNNGENSISLVFSTEDIEKLKKISSKINSNEFISACVSTSKPYGFRVLTQAEMNSQNGDYIAYSSAGIGFVSSSKLKKNAKSADKWKIAFGKADGASIKRKEYIGIPRIASPGEVMSETYHILGKTNGKDIIGFDTEEEAIACAKYIKTRFYRDLIRIGNPKHNFTQSTYRYIPNFNFTTDRFDYDKKTINWNETIDNIEEQLFKLFDYTEEEIQSVKTNVVKANAKILYMKDLIKK